MTNNDKLIALAKKTARRMARATEASYQTCLDIVAQDAGRAHWGAYLADPVPLKTDAGDLLPHVQETDAHGLGEHALRADDLLAAIMHKAMLLGMDAVGLQDGSMSSWIVGDAPMPEAIPADLKMYMHGAMSRLAGADIRLDGPFPFDHEGRSCALKIGKGNSATISLRGIELARWFGRMSPDTRISEDGTMIFPTKSAIARTEPYSRSEHPAGRRLLDPTQGRIRALLVRMGISRDEDPVREAARRRYVSIGVWKDDGALLGDTIDGRTLHQQEHLPMLVAAPPGVGKTAGTVMPYILTAANDSLVIHDETDLWQMTSGHRSQLGPVHVLRMDGSPSAGSLNPLHEDWIPKDPTRRANYLQNIANAIAPEDSPTASKILWTIREEVERSKTPSLAGVADRLKAELDIPKQSPSAQRAFEAVEPMLDPGVVDCTTSAGLKPGDLRGVLEGQSPEGWNIWRPTTLYIVRNMVNGERHARVAAILQAAIWSHAIEGGPGEQLPDAERNGPKAITIIMEGCGRLPVMPLLATALEQGRRTKVGHMIIGNTASSVARLFDERHRTDHQSLFAMQVVYPQNDVIAAATIATRFRHLGAADILSMPNGTHMIALQNLADPIWMKTRFFFHDPKLLARTYNPRTLKGPKPVVAR